jgi:oxygen-independent coproporphyrinogen-3 oxidase
VTGGAAVAPGATGPGPLGLYAHVPYCTVRCSYCDFYLRAGGGHDLPAFVGALCGEIVLAGRELPGRAADTVHFGGGTPSLLPADLLSAVLAAMRRSFALSADAEIALEANPEDLDAQRLDGLDAVGVNRLSIGVQSLDDDLLRLMRRPHDSRRAIAAVRDARRSPLRSVGVDLILGLPGQVRSKATEGIGRVLDLGVDHVSLYLLEVHGKTLLGKEVALGRRAPMDNDEAALLYEDAADLMETRGFEHYEISNFARPGHRSRHNLKYWTDREYVGFGPSAHSYVGDRRWANAADLRAYLGGGGERGARVEEDRSRARRAIEALIAGLRLAEGVDLESLRARYGAAFVPPGHALIDTLARADLVESGPGRLRLTRRGRLVSNEIFERLLPPVPQLT